MHISQQILSDITVYMKYARYIPELNRREIWDELVLRNKQMHIDQYGHIDGIKERLDEAYAYVQDKKVLPSMRSMQFAGAAIRQTPSRIFNCSYLPVDDYRAFNESMFLLLCGCGVGFSVQKHHVAKLPAIHKPTKTRRYLIADSIEGWSDAIKVLMKAYLCGKPMPIFDYSDIRPKGTALKTSGGKAPGPEPLKDCLHNIQRVLDRKQDGDKLQPIEAYDIMCFLADAVLSGGIRRSAMIALFSCDDEDMLTSKYDNWWEFNPQRARCNNSVVFHRGEVTEEQFNSVWTRIKASGAGEPGFFFTNDKNKDWGANPCNEVALKPLQFCNLVEINVSDVATQEELNNRARVASFIGTLQAGYTNFHYLRPEWKHNTEQDGLLGVSMTGIASRNLLKLNLAEASKLMVEENKCVAGMLKINPAKRIGCVKPAGTTSCVLGCSSGIHDWHSEHYVRRIRVGKNEPLYNYLKANIPQLLEDDVLKPTTQAILSVPQAAPEGALVRTTARELLERVKYVTENWIWASHVDGVNRNNVSCTVSVRDDEWDEVRDWMWANREYYTGLTVLPFDGGHYKQPPFQAIDVDSYQDMIGKLKDIRLEDVLEHDDNTNLKDQVACSGGACSFH